MPPTLDPVDTDSLGEQLQRAMPAARVVKTLNTMSAHLMVAPTTLAGDHTVFVSGDDAAAKGAVTALLVEFGWSAASIVDVGDITTARGTEMLLPLWLRLWGAFGNADFNFHIQR
jgi:predicted dinucleotide-binding enzyme